MSTFNKIDPNAPAFPPNAGWRDNDPAAAGMTVLAYIASQQMTAICFSPLTVHLDEADKATLAVQHANALIAELNK